MNKLKKINIVLIIIILIVGMFTNKTYAVLNCNVSLSTPKDKVTYKEQFSVYATISNLQTTKGIIAIGASLSYDTNSLTLVDIEGANDWSDPLYSSSSGKLTSLNNKLSTSNGTVFKITFEVNEKGKATNNAWIKINNFEISDGDEENNCGGSSINIIIEEPNTGDVEDNTQGGNQGENPGDNTIQGGNNQGGNSGDSTQNGNNQTNRPNTGTTTKPPVNTSTNEQGENIDNEKNADNNIDTNTIENNVGEDSIDNKNENIQNTLEENTKSKGNKTLFYVLGIATIIIIIGLLFLIMKYWK